LPSSKNYFMTLSHKLEFLLFPDHPSASICWIFHLP
jgi:hypothetical protein